MPLFRKRPVEVEAIQFIGQPRDRWPEPFRSASEIEAHSLSNEGDTPALRIRTLEGPMRADPGDWIIRGIKGEYYPCKPDIFDATYEPVER